MTTPTEPGWYWCRLTENSDPEPTHVYWSRERDRLLALPWRDDTAREINDAYEWGHRIDDPNAVRSVPAPMLERIRETASAVGFAAGNIALALTSMVIQTVTERLDGGKRERWAEYFGRRADVYSDAVARAAEADDHLHAQFCCGAVQALRDVDDALRTHNEPPEKQ